MPDLSPQDRAEMAVALVQVVGNYLDDVKRTFANMMEVGDYLHAMGLLNNMFGTDQDLAIMFTAVTLVCGGNDAVSRVMSLAEGPNTHMEPWERYGEALTAWQVEVLRRSSNAC